MSTNGKRMSDPQSTDDNPQPDCDTGSDQINIIASGMDEEMQQFAVQCANEAIAQHRNEKMAIAQYCMHHFEQKYGPPWHCVVSDGNLGFYVRYDASNHIYFVIGPITIFLFKSQS